MFKLIYTIGTARFYELSDKVIVNGSNLEYNDNGATINCTPEYLSIDGDVIIGAEPIDGIGELMHPISKHPYQLGQTVTGEFATDGEGFMSRLTGKIVEILEGGVRIESKGCYWFFTNDEIIEVLS